MQASPISMLQIKLCMQLLPDEEMWPNVEVC